MAWSKTKEDLLKRMQLHNNIFGNEILQIKDADEEWLIKYFEIKLVNILDYEIFINSDYAWCDCDGWSGIKDYGLEKSFGLNIHKCMEIFDYIYCRVKSDDFGNGLHWTDSVVVLNYIKDGYPLKESAYKFVRDENGRCCRNYN